MDKCNKGSSKKKKDARLRSGTVDSAYDGILDDLPSDVLPTYKDVGLAVENYKVNSSLDETNAISKVTEDIVNNLRSCINSYTSFKHHQTASERSN